MRSEIFHVIFDTTTIKETPGLGHIESHGPAEGTDSENKFRVNNFRLRCVWKLLRASQSRKKNQQEENSPRFSPRCKKTRKERISRSLLE